MKKSFHISDLLSITTGKLVSTRHMDGIYDVLSYIYGRDVFTHEIPELMQEASNHIISQLPFLKEITANNVNSENIDDYVINKVELYKKYHSIEPLKY